MYKIIRIIKIILIVFIWSQTTKYGWSQNTIRIGIIPFQYMSDNSKQKSIYLEFPNKLRETLIRSKDVNFTVEIIPDSLLKQASVNITDDRPIGGIISADILSKLNETKSVNYDYYLQGIIWEDNSIVNCYCILLERNSLKELFEISVDVPLKGHSTDGPYNFLDALVKKTLDILLIKFTKNIRIAVLDFEMTGGDSANFGIFERCLPTMLASGLSVSSRLELLETSKEDTLLREILKTEAAFGIYNYATALKIGSLLHANYLIMGEFWELGRQLRIDVRCVSIESGEITVMKGINIEEINIDFITKKMERLADDLRSAIEMDFINRGKRIPSIAVAGFPPLPYTSDNCILLSNLIQSTSRKLKIIPGIHVKEKANKVAEFLKRRHDRWEMSFELDADILISFQLDRTDPENVIVDMDVFDARNPEEFIYNATKTIPFNTMNENIGRIIDTVISKLTTIEDLNLSNINYKKIQNIKYRGLFQRYGFDFRVGALYRNDTQPFLGNQGGVVFELSFLWLPFSSSKFQIEPFTFKFDLFNWYSKQMAIGIDFLFVVKYKARPYSTVNPFFGVGIGILGIERIGPYDYLYNGGIGFALLAGWENYIGSAWHMNYELKWSGAPKVQTKEIGGSQFKGGKLGGLYFTVGIGYNW